MLEKFRKLRKIEFTFTDDQVHPDCHYVYDDVVLEDGVELMKKTHREVKPSSDAVGLASAAKTYVHPDPMLSV